MLTPALLDDEPPDTPAVCAPPDDDEPLVEGWLRGTADPTRGPSGAGRGGGGGAGALLSEPEEPELDDPEDDPELDELELDEPELDEPDDGSVDPRGTACAQAEAGTPSALVTRRQTAQRSGLNMTPSRGLATRPLHVPTVQLYCHRGGQ